MRGLELLSHDFARSGRERLHRRDLIRCVTDLLVPSDIVVPPGFAGARCARPPVCPAGPGRSGPMSGLGPWTTWKTGRPRRHRASVFARWNEEMKCLAPGMVNGNLGYPPIIDVGPAPYGRDIKVL
jgi:hypothetical protein